jgi:predicted PurR-regulated permease PerM
VDDTTRAGPGLLLARVGIGLLLLAITLVILRPFLVPAVWAAVVAYMTWGPYRRLSHLTGHPRTTAALFTLVTFLVLGVPTTWLLALGINESIHLLGVVQVWIRAGTPVPEWLTANRWLGPLVERVLEQPLPGAGEIAPRLLEIGRALSQQVLSVAGGVAQNVFAFLVTVMVLYVLYADGERISAHTRRLFAYVFPGRPADYLDHIGGVVRAVVLGVLGTALAQGTAAGIGYGIFGVPYAIGLGALTGFISLLPGGTFIVTLGATAWLVVKGHTPQAVGMLVWGLVVVGTLDSWLRPLLISRSGSGDIPFMLILFGVLGGLAAFGLPGLLFGPVVLAVVFALVAELPPPPPEGARSADTAPG